MQCGEDGPRGHFFCISAIKHRSTVDSAYFWCAREFHHKPSPIPTNHRRWCINRPSSSPITIMKLRYRKISWKSVYFRCFCGLWALWFRLICFRVICWKKICEDLSVMLIIDDDATIGHHRRSDIGIAIITNHRDDYNGNPRCSHYLPFEHGTSTQKP